MRLSVKPVAVWPSNGAAYLRRPRNYPDSINVRDSYERQSTQSCRFSQSSTCHGEYTTIFSPNRSCKFDKSLRIGGGLWRFSTSTPERSDGFDEDEEVDFAASTSDISRMVRQRVNPIKEAEERARKKREEEQLLMRRSVELFQRADEYADGLRSAVNLVQKIKQHAGERRRAHEQWMRLYEQVITSSASLVNGENQLFEEYFILKYSRAGTVGSFIDINATILKHAQAEVSNSRQALRRIELASRRIDLELQLTRLADSLGSVTERLSDYHVTPIASARRNMENILMPLSRFHVLYANLQTLGHRLVSGKEAILSLLRGITVKNPMNRSRHTRLQCKTWNGTEALLQAVHQYRAAKRISRWRGPLGRSHILTMAQNYNRISVIMMLAPDLGVSIRRLKAELATHGPASLLAHWYLHRWKEGAPRSADLDIAWRHLDVYHSFDLLYVSTRLLRSKVRCLSAVMGESGNFNPTFVAYLKEWTQRFAVMNASMLQDLELMSYYTWLRLETEDKVRRLGGVPDTISRDLFTPKDPLSADLHRFFRYVYAIGDGILQCMNLELALDRFRLLKGPKTSDLIKLLEFSPYSRGLVENLPSIAENATTTGVSAGRRKTAPLRQTNERVPAARSLAKYSRSSLALALTKKAIILMRTKATGSGIISSATGASKIAAPPSRGLCTDPRAFVNDDGRQCGVSKPDLALINKNRKVQAGLSSPGRVEDKEAAGSLVSHTEHPVIMLSHGTPDNFDEPPVIDSDASKPQYWSYTQYRAPNGEKIPVYYCKNLEQAERAAALFSASEVLGFDIEWRPQAQTTSGIKSNVSLIQIANEERIGLFHIALFRGNEIHDLVPPSLRQLLESTTTVKVGVSIKADCSRVRRHLGINTRSLFELSHLYKLVKYGTTQPKLVDRRTVNLAQQVEEVLGLPLKKDGDVRKSDWTKPLDYAQVQYAASDAYACICLHRTLEVKRKALTPIPPLPAFAELNLPILLVEEDKPEVAEPEDEIVELSVRTEKSLKLKEEGEKEKALVKVVNEGN
ncbi:3'-5' exonuclease/helicase (Wrn), putative [Talaromyces stipitatus ATCC 10500]|uniref:3'-5' exonuclease/helicase (Wrn), putative n=1 Tax=Talaromyces stipitatus (strain ATCC 10500 / CBS 375.48 / QM 6759 / NRRL 1006) TaxID=441959 RepID=B8LZE1_TALSN|nr:3'-5' exonuclease/helicase (Wrn), putative [Talaromyces stipitatus ATCC 10500]EED21694.1 3'-5' exonuclease/helicase (Wrn), putative [Talaromyces stipitatus ATCC 10500]